MPSSGGLRRRDLGREQDRLVALGDVLVERLDQVRVAAGDELVGQLDDRDLAAEPRVDRGHLEADDPAADHEQPVRGRRAARARRSSRRSRSSSGRPGSSIGREPAAITQWSNSISLPSTSTAWSEVNFAVPRTTLTLRCFASPSSPPVSFADDVVLPAAQRVEVDLGLAELDPEVRGLLGLGDHAGGVQHRLRRDAADVQADAAEALVALDQRDLEAEVGGAERRRVAADAGADDHDALALGLGAGAGSSGFSVATASAGFSASAGSSAVSSAFAAAARLPGRRPPRAPGSGRPRDLVVDRDEDLGHRAGRRARGRPSSPSRTRA